jgi:hypothetical protein
MVKSMKKKIIKFLSIEDFRSRIARLWQDQKDDEVYEFEFFDSEIKDEFYKLMRCFESGNENGMDPG